MAVGSSTTGAATGTPTGIPAMVSTKKGRNRHTEGGAGSVFTSLAEIAARWQFGKALRSRKLHCHDLRILLVACVSTLNIPFCHRRRRDRFVGRAPALAPVLSAWPPLLLPPALAAAPPLLRRRLPRGRVEAESPGLAPAPASGSLPAGVSVPELALPLPLPLPLPPAAAGAWLWAQELAHRVPGTRRSCCWRCRRVSGDAAKDRRAPPTRLVRDLGWPSPWMTRPWLRSRRSDKTLYRRRHVVSERTKPTISSRHASETSGAASFASRGRVDSEMCLCHCDRVSSDTPPYLATYLRSTRRRPEQ